MKGKLTLLIGATLFASNAQAYDWYVKGHVTSIEITYFPADIRFTLDVPEDGTNCIIVWNGSTAGGSSTFGQVDSVKAVYAALLTAKSTGQPILVYGSNPVSGSTLCTGDFIYLSS
jgi:hypothetical protein